MRRFSMPAAEQWALLAIVAFLPSIEAPKNIAAVFYLLFWLLNRLRSRDWGGPWSLWESTVFALIGGAYASAAFGAFSPDKGLSAGNDVLTYGLVFLAVRRSRYEEKFLWRVLAVSILATLLTLAYGYWGLYVTGARKTLGLHSVGHVNHSAIYVAIVFASAFAWLLACWRGRRVEVAALAVATLILWASLFISQARGAIIPALLFALLLPMALATLRGRRTWPIVLGAVVVIAGTLVALPQVVQKTQSASAAGELTSSRPALARTSLLAARTYPWFGVGITAFGKIDEDTAAAWQAADGEMFDPQTLFFASHAHGLYTNTLAERGLVGFLPLVVLLAAAAAALFRRRRAALASPLATTLWGGALGAWLITVVGGVFNTTFHHEHALITMIMLALWLARDGVDGVALSGEAAH